MIGEDYSENLFNSLGFDHYKDILAIRRSGGCVVLWRNEINLEVVRADKNVIHCQIRPVYGMDWDLLCVYGPPQGNLRNKFWKSLSSYTAQLNNPWCLVGDLNAINSIKEKKGGRHSMSNVNSEFRNFLQDRALIDMGYTGPAFTWSNGATVEKPIFERLDRTVCNTDWFFMFPDNGVLHLPRIRSDHAPILVNIHKTKKRRRKHANKFEYHWTEHPGYKDVVHNAWTGRQQDTVNKILEVGRKLNEWSRKTFGNIFRATEECKEKLLKVQMEVHVRDTRIEEKLICEEIEKLNVMQQKYYEQRSKVQWIPQMDKNTKAFHLSVMQRKKKNQIDALKLPDGIWVTEEKDIIHYLVDHFLMSAK
ncbi:uncharacterized protein LOC113295673 [Papaver somniferum]|uniref:uncharacterized protein LOC113295673 n=1 Tax=Papaver somniferum TaxID=3469 RepID=UPI000E702362|nr:uncharacterized protein LOC113295673 [Papaver somniferum]